MTLVVAFSAITHAGFVDLRCELRQTRAELTSEMRQLRYEIRQLGKDLRDDRLDYRLHNVEPDAATIKAGMVQPAGSEEVATRPESSRAVALRHR